MHFVAQMTHDPLTPADCLGQPLNWNDERLLGSATNFCFGSKPVLDTSAVASRRLSHRADGFQR